MFKSMEVAILGNESWPNKKLSPPLVATKPTKENKHPKTIEITGAKC